ncbi:TKL family protein kinase [Tritrichomonas foetus]|uniref:TKL family protein kinase n=1 Tax=Tritrichomonas foetus TaxID=1144522 RepID=A0A1J4KT52_9EUKA|nr:TKL family protein kinase [Tritrichomonas foetus]|eukprot:OHT12964.1 TKL family protein kinase [Tritrichomonas foetus]
MGVLTPYSQWIKSIQYDIMELFQNYRNVFIHQAKLAFLCTQLKTFYSDITSRKFPEVAPSPNDANVLRNLVASLKAMIEFFQTLDQSHSLDTILKSEIDAVANYLVNFQENFNKSVVSLKIVNENVFVDDQAQFMTDDFADNKKILETIQTYVTSGIALQPEILKMFELKREKINELLKSYEEKLNQMNGENVRILSQEEVFQRTQNLKKWQVDQNDFELQKKIGAGGFADVYIGIQKSTKKVVAIKILHNEEFNEQTFNLFLREVEIFGTIQHFAVLPFIGVCLTPPYYIITEYMPGGCLFNRIHSNKARLDGTKRTIIALGIAYAMEYIHRLDFLHRDLKSLNILLDADDYPKVCDFGMSRLLPNNPDELMTGCAGTLQWMAPEVLNYEKYGKKSDVYSYGILLWEILTNNIPFRGFKDVQIAMAVVNNHTRPIMPHDQAGVLGKFIKLCWDQDPNKRPTFEKIIVAFESGQLFYPGANMAIVNAYRNQYNPKQEKNRKTISYSTRTSANATATSRTSIISFTRYIE